MSERKTALRELGTNIWVADRPQRFWGLEVGTRMTVIRLDDGSLLLHSPVALDARLRRELDALGPVRFVVAPNRVHHLYAGKVADVYAESRLWIGPGLETKRPDLKYVAVLGDEAPVEWRGQLDQTHFKGLAVRERGGVLPSREPHAGDVRPRVQLRAERRPIHAAVDESDPELRPLRSLQAGSPADPRSRRGARESPAHPHLGLRPRGGGVQARPTAMWTVSMLARLPKTPSTMSRYHVRDHAEVRRRDEGEAGHEFEQPDVWR